MAAKKGQARRKPSQRFRPGLALLKPALALITVVGSAVGLTMMLDWMNDPVQWPVQTVRIEGDFRHLQAAQLQREVATLASEGFFVMNVGAIQERLQQLPWVDQVSVRRVWPDQLNIQIREQRPVARWGERGFLNSRAQAFEPAQTAELAALPQLQGPEGYAQRVLLTYQRMQAMVEPLQLSVSSLRLDARRSWRVRLSNGLTVEVGRNNPVERIGRFVRVYPAILATGMGRVMSVDLRYSNGFAVRWQQIETQARSAG